MKSIPLIKFATGVACITLATGFHASLSQGATNAPAASLTNPNPTHETAGEGLNDTEITTKVKASLLDQKNLSSTNIHVRTREGVVRLTGSVPSAAQKQTAADVAHGVTGVKSVENHLVILKS
jgi:osmotically-inducible protein OsmY